MKGNLVIALVLSVSCASCTQAPKIGAASAPIQAKSNPDKIFGIPMCIAIAEDARSVMTTRQSGVPIEELYKGLYSTGLMETLEGQLMQMYIDKAYKFSVKETRLKQEALIDMFANHYMSLCKDGL